VAAIGINVAQILADLGRDMDRERLGVLGVGSIGEASVEHLVGVDPAPAEVLLCDVYAKTPALEALRRRLAEEGGFRGPIRVLGARGEVPEAFYDSSVIVGATNVADVLDVGRLRPGTIVVDESGPHCFAMGAARDRIAARGDVVFSEGGLLEAPKALPRTYYWPPVADDVRWVFERVMAAQRPRTITGCIVSGLLSTTDSSAATTLGPFQTETVSAHASALRRCGLGSAGVNCEGLIYPPGALETFRARHGTPSPGRRATDEARTP
jgi:hypothetical protein